MGMRPMKVVFLAALTIVGGTVLARHTRKRIPGFSPQG